MVARARHSRRCGAEVLQQRRMSTRSGTAPSLLMQAVRGRVSIRQMRVVGDYGGDDERSMLADNISAYNCRLVPGTDAFRAIGWTWGGDWRSLKDYMHFSANGL